MSTRENRPVPEIPPECAPLPVPVRAIRPMRKAGMARRACYGACMVYKRVSAPASGIALILALGACASTSDRYPSLAIRDAERVHGSAQAVTPEPEPQPVQPSADLAQRLVQLRGAAARGHQAFLSAAPRTKSLIDAARGSAVASDSWVAAQASLSGLETVRNETMTSMAELDKLLLQAELEGGAREAVAATRSEVGSLLDSENATLEQMAGSLRQ